MTEVTDTSEHDDEDTPPSDLDAVLMSSVPPDLLDAPLTDETPLDEDVAVEQGAAPLPEDPDEPAGMVAGDDHIAGDSPEGAPV